MSKEDNLSEDEQLRRYLIRISYSGMGVDKELDGLLNVLRKQLKLQASAEELKPYIDDITEFLRVQEETVGSAQPKSTSSALLGLLEQFENLPLKRKDKQQLKKIKKQADNRSLDETLLALQNLLEDIEVASNSKRWNPFAKSNQVEATEDVTDSDEASLVANELIPSALRDALNNFVEQLGNIDIYRRAAENIKDQIQSLEHYDQLSALIEQIASVLLEAANNEHVQFESFLQKLNKRLLNVASYLNQAAVGQESLLSDTANLDKELTKTLSEIHQEISDTEGLGSLKGRLLSSFEHIINSVSHFKETQKNKVKASISELKIVREQLEVTEEEAERLKQNLKEQRFKAYNDPLTSLPNRYAYNERLTQEYSRWRRYRNALSLVVCDIDHFKKINDSYGHQSGDEVLKNIAKSLEHGLRESDFIARFGGEEFVILMPETKLADATKAINKLRLIIRDKPIPISPEKSISVTMSFGVAEFEGSDTATDVFNKADKALYRAKEKGRNQVCAERSQKTSD